MKKDTKQALVIGAVVFIAYNLAAFMIPCLKTPVFWISWGFTLLAFAVAGYAVYTSLIQKTDVKSRFYGFPIARIGVLYLVAQAVVGGVFMSFGDVIAWWLAVVVFAAGLAVAVIGLVSADAVVDQIQKMDEKLKKDVSVMRALQSKVGAMGAGCEGEAAAAVQALAEELRFSDPVSSEDIADADADLAAAIDAVQAAVTAGDAENVKVLCRKASAVLAERNRLCKLNK